METKTLRDKAFLFFNDSRLTYDWLHSPCSSFNGHSHCEHYQSSPEGETDVMEYLDNILDTRLLSDTDKALAKNTETFLTDRAFFD